MRVALTGTPGTGKTTVSRHVDTELSLVDLNDEIATDDTLAAGFDTDRETVIADIDGLEDRFADLEDVIFESHLAHHLSVDRVIVLRCHPSELRDRAESRGDPPARIEENVESEALDVILAEAIEIHGREAIYEIDTTGQTPDAVATEVETVCANERTPSVGTVDFLDALDT